MSQRPCATVLLSLIACAAVLVAPFAGYLFAEPNPSNEKPTIEIKILNQTDTYFDIDIGMDVPIRIRRQDILYMAEHLPFGIGRQFKVKTGSGVPIDIVLDDEALEKLKTAKLNTSAEGFVVEGLVFGKIVFKDLTPPPENFHKLPQEQFRLNEQLIAAAKEGRTFDIATLLSQGANPNTRRGMAYTKGPTERTWLERANSEEGVTADQLSELLDAGASADNETPLLYAAQNNYIDIATLLLERGADPNAITWPYKTPLYAAVSNRHPLMIRLLLDHGVALAWPERDFRRTALHALTVTPMVPEGEATAAQEHDLELLDLLLSRGVDVNVLDEYGNTVLHHLCDNPKLVHGLEMMDRIIKAGADVNQPGHLKLSPLVACMGNPFKMGDPRKVELLLRAGANVHVQDVDGRLLAAQALEYFRRLKWGHIQYYEDYVERYTQSVRLVLAAGAGADITPEEMNELLQLMPKE